MNDRSLQGKIILIIGAGRAPAPRLALAFAEEGAVVAANDLSPVLLDPLVKEIAGRGGQCKAYIADATRGMPLRAMIDEVLEDWGRIDILVNNPRIHPTTPILDMDEWDWQRTVEMNLNGPFLVTQLTARLMREQGEGVILNMVDDNRETFAQPGNGAYAASQRGLTELSLAAARELLAYNIRVHTLCPDEKVLTPALDDPASGESSGEALAQLAVYLCSSRAAHLAGQLFRVDRGQVTPRPDAPWQDVPAYPPQE